MKVLESTVSRLSKGPQHSKQKTGRASHGNIPEPQGFKSATEFEQHYMSCPKGDCSEKTYCLMLKQ